eukprot:Pgem_evm6s12025
MLVFTRNDVILDIRVENDIVAENKKIKDEQAKLILSHKEALEVTLTKFNNLTDKLKNTKNEDEKTRLQNEIHSTIIETNSINNETHNMLVNLNRQKTELINKRVRKTIETRITELENDIKNTNIGNNNVVNSKMFLIMALDRLKNINYDRKHKNSKISVFNSNNCPKANSDTKRKLVSNFHYNRDYLINDLMKCNVQHWLTNDNIRIATKQIYKCPNVNNTAGCLTYTYHSFMDDSYNINLMVDYVTNLTKAFDIVQDIISSNSQIQNKFIIVDDSVIVTGNTGDLTTMFKSIVGQSAFLLSSNEIDFDKLRNSDYYLQNENKKNRLLVKIDGIVVATLIMLISLGTVIYGRVKYINDTYEDDVNVNMPLFDKTWSQVAAKIRQLNEYIDGFIKNRITEQDIRNIKSIIEYLTSVCNNINFHYFDSKTLKEKNYNIKNTTGFKIH